MVRQASAWQVMTKMMILMSGDGDNDDGDGAMGNEVDNAGNGATGNGATGYDGNDDDDGGTKGDKVDDYGKGATGNNNDNDDDNGDGTERCNNRIEAVAGGSNSHRRSTADIDDDKDDDNCSRQNCVLGMWALCWGTSVITMTLIQQRSHAGLRR